MTQVGNCTLEKSTRSTKAPAGACLLSTRCFFHTSYFYIVLKTRCKKAKVFCLQGLIKVKLGRDSIKFWTHT